MQKSLLAILACSLSLAACNSSEKKSRQTQGQEEQNPYENCKPTAIVRSGKTYPIEWKDGRLTSYMGTEYSYDGQGRIAQIGNYFEYSYNPGGTLAAKVSKGGTTPMISDYVYKDGALIERNENIPEEGIKNKVIITTNPQGRITKEQVKNPNGKISRVMDYAYDERGNLIKTTLTSNGLRALEATYKYDDKPSITALTMPKPSPEPLSAQSPNNLTEIKKTIFGEDGSVIKTEKVKINYTYENGRVIEVETNGKTDKYLYEDCQ